MSSVSDDALSCIHSSLGGAVFSVFLFCASLLPIATREHFPPDHCVDEIVSDRLAFSSVFAFLVQSPHIIITFAGNKIKSFARLAVSNQKASKNHPCPPYKIIILDEADAVSACALHLCRVAITILFLAQFWTPPFHSNISCQLCCQGLPEPRIPSKILLFQYGLQAV